LKALAASPHATSITAATTGSPATTPVPRAPNVAVLRWSAGIVATEVTSTPPIRSSSIAARTSAATASASSPTLTSVRRVDSETGWNSNMGRGYGF
jgi:hypothetical protein